MGKTWKKKILNGCVFGSKRDRQWVGLQKQKESSMGGSSEAKRIVNGWVSKSKISSYLSAKIPKYTSHAPAPPSA